MAHTALHAKVLSALGQSIVTGELPEGAVLRMEQLEEEFAVSRSVIREVVRVLESKNLIASRRSVGVTVLGLSGANAFDSDVIRWRLAGPDRLHQLRSMNELRSGIEPVAAGFAASRAEPEHLERLTRAVMGMSRTGKAGELEEYLRHDIEFHRTVLMASGNVMFATLANVVAEVLTGRTEHSLMPRFPEPDAIRLHIEVAHAVQTGDAIAAREAMMAILDEATGALNAAESVG